MLTRQLFAIMSIIACRHQTHFLSTIHSGESGQGNKPADRKPHLAHDVGQNVTKVHDARLEPLSQQEHLPNQVLVDL